MTECRRLNHIPKVQCPVAKDREIRRSLMEQEPLRQWAVNLFEKVWGKISQKDLEVVLAKKLSDNLRLKDFLNGHLNSTSNFPIVNIQEQFLVSLDINRIPSRAMFIDFPNPAMAFCAQLNIYADSTYSHQLIKYGITNHAITNIPFYIVIDSDYNMWVGNEYIPFQPISTAYKIQQTLLEKALEFLVYTTLHKCGPKLECPELVLGRSEPGCIQLVDHFEDDLQSLVRFEAGGFIPFEQRKSAVPEMRLTVSHGFSAGTLRLFMIGASVGAQATRENGLERFSTGVSFGFKLPEGLSFLGAEVDGLFSRRFVPEDLVTFGKFAFGLYQFDRDHSGQVPTILEVSFSPGYGIFQSKPYLRSGLALVF